ncbi:MAG: sigma-54 dependent transcriptional regulator [Verrucomicrobiota bacterium]
MKHILVVDDEEGSRESLKAIFWNSYQVITTESAEKAVNYLKDRTFDLVILDILLPEKDGMQFLKEVRSLYPDVPVIMVSAVTSTKTMAEAIRLGAVDFISKPFEVHDVRTIAERAIAYSGMMRQIEVTRREKSLDYSKNSLIGETIAIRQVRDKAAQLASKQAPILILGESGTGKKLFVRHVHSTSQRSSHPLIILPCSSLPESMIEEEIFGRHSHSANTFELETLGRLDLAKSSTLLIQDVHVLSETLQQKLIDVTLNGSFRRVGGIQEIQTTASLAFTSASTDLDTFFNRQISEMYPNSIVLIPSLRDRKEDLALLSYFFLNSFKQTHSVAMSDIEIGATELIRKYNWPGNVKELKDTIEHIASIYPDQDCLKIEHLPCEIKNRIPLSITPSKAPNELRSLKHAVNELQRDLIIKALHKANGKQVGAAKILRTTPRILKTRMKQLNIQTIIK